MLYPIYVAHCIEHVKRFESTFNGVIFSFNRESLQEAIDKDKSKNTEDCWWEYIGIVEVMCDEDTKQKLKVELRSNNCGWILKERKDLKFFKMVDPEKFCPVVKGDGFVGFLKR